MMVVMVMPVIVAMIVVMVSRVFCGFPTFRHPEFRARQDAIIEPVDPELHIIPEPCFADAAQDQIAQVWAHIQQCRDEHIAGDTANRIKVDVHHQALLRQLLRVFR